jgi:nucleotide-binding universal stress UspA family protein
MSPIRTILCPVDFSEHSAAAFRLAGMLARDQKATLVVVHIYLPAGPVAVDGHTVGEIEHPPGYLERLRQALDGLQAPAADVPVRRELVEGEPVEAILHLARTTPCDLIVMGTHGRPGLERLLLGSVAAGVMERASCPVVTVRSASPEERIPGLEG